MFIDVNGLIYIVMTYLSYNALLIIKIILDKMGMFKTF